MPPKRKSSGKTVSKAAGGGNGKAAAGKPAATSLIVLSVLSIAFGVALHVRSIHMSKYPNLNYLKTDTVANMKNTLKLPRGWPGTDVYDRYGGEAWRFFLVLIVFFQDALRERIGQAIFLLLTSASMPLMAFMALETSKDGRHRFLNVGTLIFVTGLGQLIMVGAATPIVFVPLYAAARWSETPSTVHPLPAPATWKVVLNQVCSTLAISTIFLSTFTPLDKPEAFVRNNIIFQFYPLAWLPLVFVPLRKTVVSMTGSASARQEPRLAVARCYELLSYITVPIYYFGLYWGGKQLLQSVANGLDLKSAGPYLLFWDTVGLIGSTCLVVLIDSIVDEAKVSQGAKRTHARRLLLEDILIGSPGAVIFGPGWAAARYFQRRELLAEQARFGSSKVL